MNIFTECLKVREKNDSKQHIHIPYISLLFLCLKLEHILKMSVLHNFPPKKLKRNGNEGRRETMELQTIANSHFAVHSAEFSFLHSQVSRSLQEVRSEEPLLDGFIFISTVPGSRTRP